MKNMTENGELGQELSSIQISTTNSIIYLMLVILIGMVLPGVVTAQSTVPDPILTVSTPEEIHTSPGSIAQFDLEVNIVDGWHINTNPASLEGLIPTDVAVGQSRDRFSVSGVDYPPGKEYQFEFTSRPITVYEGRTILPTRIQIPGDIPEDSYEIPVVLTYQACDDSRCLPPKTKTTVVEFHVSGQPGGGEQSPWPTIWSGASGVSSEGKIGSTFRNQGMVFGILLIFVLGLSLNLTPCVYPMIPITVGYFGGRERNRFSKRLLDAVFFVLGMSLIYAILGALAGFGGSMLGDALQNPWVLSGLAGLMVLLSGSMFGIYELKLPAPVLRQSEELGKALGTFGMGMVLGVVAAPCLAPSTVALLGFVGQLQSTLAGAGLFFVLALGLGLPYVFLAVFSSQLQSLPGSGRWMEWVKHALGFVILAVAVYFIWPMLTNAQFGYTMMVLVLVAGVYLSLIIPPESMVYWSARGLLVGTVTVTLVLMVGWTFVWVPDPIDWEPAESYLHSEPSTVQKPTVVYIGASWCVPCKEMEVTTFRDRRVRKMLQQDVRAVKLDLSTSPSERVQRWLEEKEVLGVPTIIFIKKNGEEDRSLRLMGYVSGEKLVKQMNRFTEDATG